MDDGLGKNGEEVMMGFDVRSGAGDEWLPLLLLPRRWRRLWSWERVRRLVVEESQENLQQAGPVPVGVCHAGPRRTCREGEEL